jgi:hypothetical protein
MWQQTAAALAACALYPAPYLQYFAVCFFGVSEISTVVRYHVIFFFVVLYLSFSF